MKYIEMIDVLLFDAGIEDEGEREILKKIIEEMQTDILLNKILEGQDEPTIDK